MEQTSIENIRNVVLLSHSGAGKTSLSEAMLFATGAISRLGKVDDGTTTSDYDPAEIKRKISINLSILPCQWQDTKLNILDTPGYFDFVAEVRAGIRVAEGAVVVVCANSGVEVGTEQVWGYAQAAGLPRLIFINKMDRENADFSKSVKSIQAKFGAKCVPVQVPIGAHNDFQGIIDLLNLKAYMGNPVKEAEVPPALQNEVKTYREKLVEAVAEVDDKLLEKYLGGEELSQAEISSGLQLAAVTGKITPIFVGSALKNIGIGQLLDALKLYLPSPKDRPILLADNDEKLDASPDAPLAALVFKTSADPYVGKLTYFRVFRGVMSSNSQALNANRGEAERIGQLFVLRGKNQEPVAQIKTGDIGAVAKLSLTNTGDTLCAKEKPVKVAPIKFPAPIFSEAVYPKTKADLDKLGTALSRLTDEDPTLRVKRDPDTNETVVYGIGETQLEVAAEKMQQKFGVSVELKTPKVPYKETITTATQAEYKHKKQTGGHGQYGHVVVSMEPLPRGTGLEFVDKIVGASIPRNYIPAVEKGVNEGAQEGILARYPVTDVRVTAIDGSFHPVDSSEICFKIAGAGAVKKGLGQAQPVLLEPIMNIKVTVPKDYTGDIIGDLNTKRAQLQGMNPEDGMNVIEAQVPLAEILRYAIDLKSITQGRGTFTMEFSHYQEAPAHITQKIIAERAAEKVEK